MQRGRKCAVALEALQQDKKTGSAQSYSFDICQYICILHFTSCVLQSTLYILLPKLCLIVCQKSCNKSHGIYPWIGDYDLWNPWTLAWSSLVPLGLNKVWCELFCQKIRKRGGEVPSPKLCLWRFFKSIQKYALTQKLNGKTCSGFLEKGTFEFIYLSSAYRG